MSACEELMTFSDELLILWSKGGWVDDPNPAETIRELSKEILGLRELVDRMWPKTRDSYGTAKTP